MALHHLRALPRPLPATPAGPVLSLTIHAALLGAAVACGGGGERLHWVGIGEGEGTGVRTPGALAPHAYVVPGRRGLRGGAPGGGARTGAPAGDAPADRLPPIAPPAPLRSATALADVVLPEVALPEAATTLVAGILAAAPDPSRTVARPEEFTRMRPTDPGEWLADHDAAMSLTAARANALVDVLPIPLLGNPRPAYPSSLARASVGGRVVVEFRIDSAGAVEPGSLHVVQSTDERFTEAVRGVLPRLRFVPAQLRAHAVGIVVRQPFVFRVARR
ncbi:TonB family protein [Roseisolibacter sp. H3M3-2]|uniref:TonB family protein n=1 Tax=Roseisolibacter sp. H3M3-2 TaxID=3031323 RepID=UPI0023D9CE0F|nr:TonB family protein [Roseisolibacter sp. H3M3-2]MDF1504613.1 TonB family protein [Roseisolibacter sp. H3M3-2]